MKFLAEMFYLDLRSLAVFRIGLGLIILCDLFLLWPDSDAFFGPHSIYPIQLFQHDPYIYWHWSFHALSDQYWFIGLLFAINAICAMALIVGFYTRLSAFLCWLMAISLMHRNPLVMGIGRDYGLIFYLMWGTLLPLGARYSLDNVLGKKQTIVSQRILSPVSIGLICSIIMIYLICGWCKTDAVWTKNYLALKYVLNNTDFVKPFGIWLLQFPHVLKILTLLTILLERYFILFLLFPVRNDLCRGVLVITFCLLHAGMFFSINVDWFALVMMTAWCALIPSSWWRGPMGRPMGQNALINIIGSVLLVFVFIWNYLTFQEFFYHKNRPAIFKTTQVLGLDFAWELFSPSPPLYERHCYLEPILENSALAPKDPLEKNNFMRRYQFIDEKNIRWKYLGDRETARLMPYLGSYLVYYWNKTYPQGPRVKAAVIHFYKEAICLKPSY